MIKFAQFIFNIIYIVFLRDESGLFYKTKLKTYFALFGYFVIQNAFPFVDRKQH